MWGKVVSKINFKFKSAFSKTVLLVMLAIFFLWKCVFPDRQIMDTHDLYEGILLFLRVESSSAVSGVLCVRVEQVLISVNCLTDNGKSESIPYQCYVCLLLCVRILYKSVSHLDEIRIGELTKWHGWNAAYTLIVCGIGFIFKYLNKPDCKEERKVLVLQFVSSIYFPNWKQEEGTSFFYW